MHLDEIKYLNIREIGKDIFRIELDEFAIDETMDKKELLQFAESLSEVLFDVMQCVNR